MRRRSEHRGAPYSSCMARRWRHSRPSICKSTAGPIPRSWTGSLAAASIAGAWTWWALDQRARRQCPHCTRGGRLFRGCDLHSAAPRQAAIARLWHFVRRVARALFAQRHPQLVARLALDAMVWTGEGSPTLAERKKKLPEFRAKNRRPIDKAFIYSLFDRDHPSTAEEKVIDAFADAVTALDSSVPTGTYVDMCSNLPVVDPEKITVPTLIMRGQWDGIASFQDLLAFFARLPNPDKHFALMPGISHASFQQNNYALVYHILWSFFT